MILVSWCSYIKNKFVLLTILSQDVVVVQLCHLTFQSSDHSINSYTVHYYKISGFVSTLLFAKYREQLFDKM